MGDVSWSGITAEAVDDHVHDRVFIDWSDVGRVDSETVNGTRPCDKQPFFDDHIGANLVGVVKQETSSCTDLEFLELHVAKVPTPPDETTLSYGAGAGAA
jgi:hypothetical protein